MEYWRNDEFVFTKSGVDVYKRQLLGSVAGLHQFAFAAHGFFAVGIGVIEVGYVGGYADEGCHNQYGTCLLYTSCISLMYMPARLFVMCP